MIKQENNEYNPRRIWIIEVTEEQLYDIINDVEDIHRFLAGQTELMNASCYSNHSDELQERLKELQSLVTPHLTRGMSYGWNGGDCPNEAQREKIKRGYGIYRNLRHCLEKFIGRNNWNVYQSPTLTCGVPLATCYPKK